MFQSLVRVFSKVQLCADHATDDYAQLLHFIPVESLTLTLILLSLCRASVKKIISPAFLQSIIVSLIVISMQGIRWTKYSLW